MHVDFAEGMSVLTDDPAFSVRSNYVYVLRDGLHARRVQTDRIRAQVIQHEPIGDWPPQQLVRKSMG